MRGIWAVTFGTETTAIAGSRPIAADPLTTGLVPKKPELVRQEPAVAAVVAAIAIVHRAIAQNCKRTQIPPLAKFTVVCSSSHLSQLTCYLGECTYQKLSFIPIQLSRDIFFLEIDNKLVHLSSVMSRSVINLFTLTRNKYKSKKASYEEMRGMGEMVEMGKMREIILFTPSPQSPVPNPQSPAPKLSGDCSQKSLVMAY
ncbi:hypothetical protein [Nostoc sp. PCC 7524]|uniref:hypothetical protein n=1 Tax=Nostoc sp. (strain ATCC 29411 / PCC 7524) TaxID=28072 RepID=UPI000B0AA6F3|nr:hypothetical protein [Nostoc sp. PCC 7524]